MPKAKLKWAKDKTVKSHELRKSLCKIGPELISLISDTTPIKQGKVTPGMHVPVVDPSVFHKSKPNYTILFAWNHEEEILAKESNYTANIGKWIRFVPKVEVI